MITGMYRSGDAWVNVRGVFGSPDLFILHWAFADGSAVEEQVNREELEYALQTGVIQRDYGTPLRELFPTRQEARS